MSKMNLNSLAFYKSINETKWNKIKLKPGMIYIQNWMSKNQESNYALRKWGFLVQNMVFKILE